MSSALKEKLPVALPELQERSRAIRPGADAVLDAIPVAVCIFRPAQNGTLVCRYSNASFDTMMRIERHHAIGLPLASIPFRCDVEEMSLRMTSCLATGNPVSFEWSHPDPTVQMRYRCDISVIEGENGAREIALTCTDQSSEHRAKRQLAHASLHDPLTGFPNRVLFMEQVERALENCGAGTSSRIAVLFLNIDRFKHINESLGHVAGDELLISVARRLLSCIRAGDTLARVSGDEFAILVEDVGSAEEASLVAERVHRQMRQAFIIGKNSLVLSVSIGIAVSEQDDSDVEHIIQNADFAMHRAKQAGRGRTEFHHQGQHRRAAVQFKLENDLRCAIQNRQIELFYQPIVDLGTGRIHAFEALARWNHPDQGWIPPGDFIAMAEETGLIVPLGRFALFEACRQLGEWRQRFPEQAKDLRVGVNVSGMQVARDNLVRLVEAALKRARLPGNRLKLEITESVIVENPELTIETLRQLKALSVVIAMDDFGTGYSSLSYLQRLPIDTLKIDRSFIADMLENEDSYKIVTAIISLAQKLGKTTIAEGIEQVAQAETLKSLGCNLAQGYHYARAIPASEAEVMLSAMQGPSASL